MLSSVTIGAAEIAGQYDESVAARIQAQSQRGDYVIVAAAVVIFALAFVLWNQSVLHWFLVPLMLCGILTGVDIVRWLRGKLDLFDPKTIIACMAFYGFFIAPLLNVCFDTFGAGDLEYWGDWRPWLGAMAALNCLGLCVYRFAQNVAVAHTKPSPNVWAINERRTYPFFAFGLLLSLAGTVAFLWQLNGISGMVRSFEAAPEVFAGKGWLLIFAWPLSVLVFICFVYLLTCREQRADRGRNLVLAVVVLVCAAIVHFLIVGSYGSRGTTVWALFWMLGIIHYRIRKLPKKIMAAGIIFLIGFMYLYGFYKERKTEAFGILRAPSHWLQPEGYERDFKYLLLGDLARADSNAFMLRNIVMDPSDYDYRWGLTYAGALAILVPRAFWPQRPEVRVDAGSEALWGKATQLQSSRLYGLSGEALLNFGPWGVAPLFGVYGALLGWYRRKLRTWDSADARMFLAPFFTVIIVMGLVYDSDVLLFSLITEGTLITLVLFAASRQSPRQLAAARDK